MGSHISDESIAPPFAGAVDATSEEPPIAQPSRWISLLRVGYLILVGAVSVFLVSFLAVSMVEAFGPSTTADGQVLDRISGTTSTTNCTYQPRRCFTMTFPNYTVVGERADGSGWIVVGEGPYEAMRGKSGNLVQVTTSSVTNRVVGLDGDDSWTMTDSGMIWFALGGLAIWLPLVVAYEFARRRGRWKLGRFSRIELLALVPSLLIGLTGAWFVIYSTAHGLDVVTSQDRYGGFLADPIAFSTSEPEPAGEGNPIPTGRWVGDSSEVVVVDAADLAPDLTALLSDDGDLLAIPLMQQSRGGAPDRVELRLVAEGGAFDEGAETIDCPDALPEFSGNGPGIRCFEADALRSGRRQLMLTIGSGAFTDPPRLMDYEPAFIDRRQA